MSATTFQPMPGMSAEDYAALKEHIAEHGILHPVVIDQHGRILDGHHRTKIARELGIDRPVRVQEVADDHEAWSLAVSLNCLGRQLSQEQKRAVIVAEMGRCPDDSDRAIARRVGCSPSTVGTVRAQRLAEAEDSIRQARESIQGAISGLFGVCLDLVKVGADLHAMIDHAHNAVTHAEDELAALAEDETADPLAAVSPSIDLHVYRGLRDDLQVLADDLAAEGWTGCPRVKSESWIEGQVAALFPYRSRVQSGHPAEGGGRR